MDVCEPSPFAAPWDALARSLLLKRLAAHQPANQLFRSRGSERAASATVGSSGQGDGQTRGLCDDPV